MVRIQWFGSRNKYPCINKQLDKFRKWSFDQPLVLCRRFQSLLLKWIYLYRCPQLQVLCSSSHFCNVSLQRNHKLSIACSWIFICSTIDLHWTPHDRLFSHQCSDEWAFTLCWLTRKWWTLIRTCRLHGNYQAIHPNLRNRECSIYNVCQVWHLLRL